MTQNNKEEQNFSEAMHVSAMWKILSYFQKGGYMLLQDAKRLDIIFGNGGRLNLLRDERDTKATGEMEEIGFQNAEDCAEGTLKLLEIP
ncbi:hypothetical protein AVEN_217217-1 [Araneus ventricosus]|uniref:Uncharacterized protein n=1 Tax=Araneus ventricosus TaxID=182803 RepID=A0A4Y2U896_ARAVE|nr:hypothetical protein AVEN_217217-1 [Araneus ventricosus]